MFSTYSISFFEYFSSEVARIPQIRRVECVPILLASS